MRLGGQRGVKLCVDSLGAALALVDAAGNQRVLPGEYTVTVGVAGGVRHCLCPVCVRITVVFASKDSAFP